MRCKFESFCFDLMGGLEMNSNKREKNRKRAVQVVVILLIAAVVVTYSITFVGSFL